MTLIIQDYKTDDVLFQTDDAFAVPAVGETLYLESEWYKVVERNFYFRKLTVLYDNSITLWVEKI